MRDDVYLDNLPQTANYILNILWDRNREMTAVELTEAVNSEYDKNWEKADVQKFIDLLVTEDYVVRKRRGLRVCYHALGMEYVSE